MLVAQVQLNRLQYSHQLRKQEFQNLHHLPEQDVFHSKIKKQQKAFV